MFASACNAESRNVLKRIAGRKIGLEFTPPLALKKESPFGRLRRHVGKSRGR